MGELSHRAAGVSLDTAITAKKKGAAHNAMAASLRAQGANVVSIGHNSGDLDEAAESRARQEADPEVGGIAVDRLRSIVERIERLEEEKKALSNDIKDIYGEAKSGGFDVKVVRTLIAQRKKEPAEVEEQETLLDLYRRALRGGGE